MNALQSEQPGLATNRTISIDPYSALEHERALDRILEDLCLDGGDSTSESSSPPIVITTTGRSPLRFVAPGLPQTG